jgi:5-formyltetrahydrofolate cyclo-ligase
MEIEQTKEIIGSSKKILRKELRKLLLKITEKDLVSQSDEIFKKIISLKQYQESKNISIYLHMPKGEVRTEDLLKHALKSGKNCYVPYIINNTEMEMVRIHSWEEFLSYPKSKWGYPEPSGMTEDTIALKNDGLDMIIVPGMAFDLNGNRLGHGKGYYDRYIERAREFSKLRNMENPYCVSLSLKEQLLNKVIPTDQYDIKPDVIVTPHNVFYNNMKDKTEENKMAETEELDEWELEEHEPIAIPKIEKKKYTLQTEEYNNGYTPQIKILKRDKDVGIKEREQNEIKRNVITTTKSLAEREEEYRRARLRIFGN